MDSAGSLIRSQKPFPQHWANFKIGRSGFLLAATIHSSEHRIGVELYLNGPNAKQDFQALLLQKDEIEAEMGSALAWMELPERKGSRIALFKSGIDPMDQQNWPMMREWLHHQLERLDNAFRNRVRVL